MTPELRRAAPRGIFGWRATDLARVYSVAELAAIAEVIENEPGARTPTDSRGHPLGTIFIYCPKARRRLDALSWAVTYALRRDRAGQGSDRAQ